MNEVDKHPLEPMPKYTFEREQVKELLDIVSKRLEYIDKEVEAYGNRVRDLHEEALELVVQRNKLRKKLKDMNNL